VIEKPLPLAPKKREGDGGALLVREPRVVYGGSSESDVLVGLKPFRTNINDHVISTRGGLYRFRFNFTCGGLLGLLEDKTSAEQLKIHSFS
jgi:hypothetical protein